MAKLVLALGGNALQIGNNASPKEQLQACQHTAKCIVELLKQDHYIAIVHGNGPQVGEIASIIELANKVDAKHPLFPFDVCNAFTQGYIGYQLQNAIGDELAICGIKQEVVTIITQLEVDKADSAFANPTKPIGSFYPQDVARTLMAKAGYQMREDAGRGWRRVIASPKPVDIVEKNVICNLFTKGVVTISCGGGGIPVVKNSGKYVGVTAVIDKDFAAAKLAEVLGADMLIILTAVEKVAINFGQPNQEDLSTMSVATALQHIKNKQFAPGSMLPKIQAAINFLLKKPQGKVLITSLDKAALGIRGLTGTIIHS